MNGDRAKNRARMAAAMPECLALIDALKAEGMFGRVCAFEIFSDEIASQE